MHPATRQRTAEYIAIGNERMSELNRLILDDPEPPKRKRGHAKPKRERRQSVNHVERGVCVDPHEAEAPICCGRRMNSRGFSAGSKRFMCRDCKRYVRFDPETRYCSCGRKKHMSRSHCHRCRRRSL